MKNRTSVGKYPFWAALLMLPFLMTSSVHATPSAVATYTETDLGGGLWEYDYVLLNSSNPLDDAGFDIYDFFLAIDPSANITDIATPADWDFFSDSLSFITWMSLWPGEPPAGSDVAPGASLSGFRFTSDVQLASLSFEVTIANPSDYENPIVYGDRSFPATTAIPEPGTMLLLGNGLVALALLRKKFHKR